MTEAYTYILRCSDDTLYTGWTTDLERRVRTHNTGRGSRYTRGRLPVRLIFWEGHSTRREARSREQALRHMSRDRKLRLIASRNNTQES